MSRRAVGDTGPPFTIGPLTRTDFVRYAGAAADFNPLHHDDEHARRAGNPSVFAHGMFSGGLLASFLVKWFGPDTVRRFSVRFRDRVWPGDIVSAEGTIRALGETDGTATVEIVLRRHNGDVLVTGEAEVVTG